MCMPKPPKMETPPPPPTIEQAKTDDVVDSRKNERERLRNAANARSTILNEGASNGRKTLLGQ